MFFGENYDLEGNIGVIEERGDERRWELVIRGEKEIRPLRAKFSTHQISSGHAFGRPQEAAPGRGGQGQRPKSPADLRRLKATAPYAARPDLELQNRGKLQASRATAPKERIPDAHVAGGGERVICGSSAEDVAARRGIGCANIPDKIRQQRIREIRMVKDVEEFSPQLEIHALTETRVL